jgi:tetratricopeptide (TPR) repeat protein
LRKHFDEAIELHQQALQIARAIGHTEGEAQDLANLALVFRDQGDLPQVLAYLIDALRSAEVVHQPEILWRIHAGHSSTYRRMNETEQAIAELETFGINKPC